MTGKIRVYIESRYAGIDPFEEEYDAPENWDELSPERQREILDDYYDGAAETFIEGGVEYVQGRVRAGRCRMSIMGGWSKPSEVGSDVLKLHEVVLLRRLMRGENQTQAARALGITKNAATGTTKYLRARFAVDTTAELLELPQVREQLGDGS